jgi:hypothetical protein
MLAGVEPVFAALAPPSPPAGSASSSPGRKAPGPGIIASSERSGPDARVIADVLSRMAAASTTAALTPVSCAATRV